jgi:uncharacterized protein (TIGR00251 family)
MKQKILIYAQPGARQPGFAGYFDGKMKIKLNAPAQDNQANQALIIFLTEQLNIPKNIIKIIQGLHNRRKTVSIDSNYSAAEIIQKITSV